MIANAAEVGNLQSLVSRAEAICQDYRLGAVEEHCKETGQIAMGYLPVYVPLELFHSQGVLPVGLIGAGPDLEIIRGDAYYQSYICHLPRSTIEMGLNGSLDVLSGMLFPATCDVIRNLSGMWLSLFKDKFVKYFDVPQNFDPELGGMFYRGELEEISRAMVEYGGTPYDPEALRDSIRIYNKQRRLIAELYEYRAREPWKCPTEELYLILRAGMQLAVEKHIDMLAEYRQLIEADESRKPMDQARVMLTGSFCEQPPIGLIKTLERSGCYIVDDDFMQVFRWIKGDIKEDGDPLENLVLAFLNQSIASPIRYIDEDVKGQELIERAKESGAEGVLFCAPSFCDPALLDQPMLQNALDKAEVPWTAFKFAENSGQFQVIREQSGTFADSIKLWSGN